VARKRRIIEISARNRRESITLPINPPEIDFTETQLNQKVTLLNMGEVNLAGNRGLVTGPLSSFFPGSRSPFYHLADMEPEEYIQKLKKWKDGGNAVRVIVSDMDFNKAMLIDGIRQQYREGDGDIYYTVDFSENRTLNVPTVKVDTKVRDNGLGDRPNTQENPKTYTVKSGDCLWNLAKKFYGDGAQYTKIYEANKGVIGGDPNKIYPGQVYTIP